MTPLTTRFTVPLADGVSGVLLTLMDVSSDTVWATMTSASAKYPSGRSATSKLNCVPLKLLACGIPTETTTGTISSALISSIISTSYWRVYCSLLTKSKTTVLPSKNDLGPCLKPIDVSKIVATCPAVSSRIFSAASWVKPPSTRA